MSDSDPRPRNSAGTPESSQGPSTIASAEDIHRKWNEEQRALTDRAKTWAQVPSAYRDMVLSELGDFRAYCRIRDDVDVKLFEGSRARELARGALEAAVPARVTPEHRVPVFRRDREGVYQQTSRTKRCPGSGKRTQDDWYCPDGGCGKDVRKMRRRR